MRITLVAIARLTLAGSAWAQFLPPEEFDRPFEGRVVIQEAINSEEVRKLCHAVFTMVPLGCSYRMPSIKWCAIVKVPDDQIRAAGYDPDIFMRHEIGHCNGWPATHKGAR
jgi:hypothetical protein